MKIRAEKESEINQITKIHDQAFSGPDEGKIVENFRKNENLTISLVCEINGNLAGHIATSLVFLLKNISILINCDIQIY